MSTIRCIYDKEPSFPATDQHPDAERYVVGAKVVDAIGGPPSQAEIDVVLGNDSAGLARAARTAVDESERQSCKVDGTIMALVNMDKAAWITWAGTNFPTLTAAERNRLGQLFWVVSIGVRRSVRNGG